MSAVGVRGGGRKRWQGGTFLADDDGCWRFHERWLGLSVPGNIVYRHFGMYCGNILVKWMCPINPCDPNISRTILLYIRASPAPHGKWHTNRGFCGPRSRFQSKLNRISSICMPLSVGRWRCS
jgi:hypothetical protein